MDEKRFKQIEALQISKAEMKEFFLLKDKEEYRRNFVSFPLKLLWDSGVFTDKLREDDQPLGFKIGKHLFFFDFEKYTKPQALAMTKGLLPVADKFYRIQLPERKHMMMIYDNRKKINACIEAINKLYGRQERMLKNQIFWLRENKTSDYSAAFVFHRCCVVSCFLERLCSTLFMAIEDKGAVEDENV